MNVKYDVVQIRMNELSTVNKKVAPWETPVLQAIHGEDVIVKGSEIVAIKAVLSPEDEYARLANRYGPRDETKYVERVYGAFGPGYAAIGRIMAAAFTDKPVSAQPAAPVADLKARKDRSFSTDDAVARAQEIARQFRETQTKSTEEAKAPLVFDPTAAKQATPEVEQPEPVANLV